MRGPSLALRLDVRSSPLSILLLAAVDALGAPMARAQSQTPVQPIPARSNTATGVPAATQADDDETPRSHHGAETFNRTVPTESEPESSQLAVGFALSLVTVLAAIKAGSSTSGDRQLWYGAAVLAGGAAATGAIVCAIGQTSPTRHGGCRASILGALIGAVGAVPGLLLLKRNPGPCTATGPNADDACVTGAAVDGLLDLSLAGVGYMLGTAFGARMGWELGAASRYVAPAPAANVSLLSLQF